ncbi:MAG: hypothetical protein EBR82_40400 [Caulobacteraceae bacterium]|nr:hypothetical protein [Caulobacteraceae bacterium]
MKCPSCQHIFAVSLREIAQEMGRKSSPAKAETARANGKRGGRPKKTYEQRNNPKSEAVRARNHGEQIQR